jgi:hypothetical protein
VLPQSPIADEPSRDPTDRPIPLRVFARVPLPEALAQAIGAVLDADARESNAKARAELRLRTRGVLEAWLDGAMSTPQVVRALQLTPRMRIGVAR